MKYSYDEDGLIFNYFLIAILMLFLVPYTLSKSLALTSSKKPVNNCRCEPCQTKRKTLAKLKPKSSNGLSTTTILVSLAWVLLAYSVYQASTRSLTEELWDPYAILGVDSGSTVAQVKSAFRKMARTHHPDKVAEADKEKATLKYTEMNKAYKVLTNEDARKIWEEFGNADGKQAAEYGIALPSWLVEKKNSFFVLGIYALIFGVGLPMWVARWWGGSKNFTKDKIMHETMNRFYMESNDKMTMKQIAELLCAAEEFRHIIPVTAADSNPYSKLTEKVKSELLKKTGEKFDKSKKFHVHLPYHFPTLTLLYAYLLRIKIDDLNLKAQQTLVIEKASRLISGILQIAISRNWLNVSLFTIDLGQCITQALHYSQPPICQLPFLDNPDCLKYLITKKRSVKLTRDYVLLSETEKTSILKELEKENFKLIDEVAEQYPLLRLTKAKFTVFGEKAIIPQSIVTLIVKFKLESKDEFITFEKNNSEVFLNNSDDPADEEEKPKHWWKTDNDQIVPVHAPYFPDEKKPIWWVILGNSKDNRLITVTKVVVNNQEGEARLQFQAPGPPGKMKFHVYVKSDSYVGCDGHVEIELHVQGFDASPLDDFEDDISEPDIDTLAGQMQAMKDMKSPKGEFDDSSDEEDDEPRGGHNEPHDHSDPNHHH
ncbi:secretory subunit [Lobulomyces angularis]|nr:secretory subunit [Lobulomyces angularis]